MYFQSGGDGAFWYDRRHCRGTRTSDAQVFLALRTETPPQMVYPSAIGSTHFEGTAPAQGEGIYRQWQLFREVLSPLDFIPSAGMPHLCTLCKRPIQLWNLSISKKETATGMMILDPDKGESQAYHFECARKAGRRWSTVHVGYFIPEMGSDEE